MHAIAAVLVRSCLAAFALLAFSSSAHAACTTSSASLTFAPSTSYDVRASAVAQVGGSAGLSCTGSTLSLLGGSYAKATVTSANGFRLSAGAGDLIPYVLSADAAGTQTFTQGSTIDYMSSNLISLLGNGSASNFNATMYAKLSGSPNIAAGTYTDTVTVAWDYAVCNGAQIGTVCVGYDSNRVTRTVTVTLVVGKDCRISAPNLSFGTAPLVSQFQPVTQSVLVDCTKGAAYKVAFTSGGNNSARPWRTMTDGLGRSIQYNLYYPDGSTIWDESSAKPSASAGTGETAPSQMQTYVAKVNPAQTTPPAGIYSDQLVVVVSF
jgi:spore coat protein U-like protein